MPGLFSNHRSDDIDFELFSNMVLKFSAVLVVVLVLLAINVGQKLDQIISTNRFSGGTTRPQLYIGAYRTDDYEFNNTRTPIIVALESPSSAQTPTKVTEEGLTVPINDSDTFSGRYTGSPASVLALLAGISPGLITINGQQTPFVVPNYSSKNYIYKNGSNISKRVPPSNELALRFLRLWSDLYANPVFRLRAFSEYKSSRTRIYVQSGEVDGQRRIFFGGDFYLSESQIKSGILDFLIGLSSASTEIVYLGNDYVDSANQTSLRVDFYREHGFLEAAEHLHSRLFPDPKAVLLAKSYYEKLPNWDQARATDRTLYLANAKGDIAIAHKRFETNMARLALSNYRSELLAENLKNDTPPDRSMLPNSLAYPDAWRAYVDFKMKSAARPPAWFVTEFLEALGFDKRVTTVE